MDFVAIDFETAKRSMESACAVGLVKYLGDEKVDSFYSLIRPPVLYIRPDFTEIHGITVDDVRDAPDWYELAVPEYEYFDSLAVARRVWPEFGNHKLTFLGEQFGIEYEAHNALADAETCAKVILRQCTVKSAEYVTDTDARHLKTHDVDFVTPV